MVAGAWEFVVHNRKVGFYILQGLYRLGVGLYGVRVGLYRLA